MKWQNARHGAVSGLLGGLLCFSSVSWAKPLQFVVKENAGSVVSFTSDAPVELIQGKTNQVQGVVSLDDSFQLDAKHPFKINFTVNAGSFDTGIALRNEHMRDNFLETSQYPQSTYQATSVRFSRTKLDLHKPQRVTLVSTGDFSLHGVTVKKSVPLTVDYVPANGKTPASIRIRGKFPVRLQQHHIQRPEAILVKLAETVFVTVDLLGTAQ